MKPLALAALSAFLLAPAPLFAQIQDPVGEATPGFKALEKFKKGGQKPSDAGPIGPTTPTAAAKAPAPSSAELNEMLRTGQEYGVISRSESLANPEERKFWTALAWFQLGEKRSKANELSGAVDAYQSAFKIWGRQGFPGIPSPSVRAQAVAARHMNNLGIAQLRQGRRADAAASFQESLEMIKAARAEGVRGDGEAAMAAEARVAAEQGLKESGGE